MTTFDLVFETVPDFLRPESMLFHLATFQTTHCLSIHVDAIPKSRRTRSTRMNLVSRKKRMSAGVVLLQKYSAQQVRSHSRYLCIEGSS